MSLFPGRRTLVCIYILLTLYIYQNLFIRYRVIDAANEVILLLSRT